MEELMNEIRYLCHLQHLRMISCNFQSSNCNNIWRLPKLTHLNLTAHPNNRAAISPTETMPSLRNLSIQGETIQVASLKLLLQFTPCLERLSISPVDYYLTKTLSFTLPSIDRLHICFESTTNGLKYILQLVQNLSHLTILTARNYIDGYQWEQWITDYLPKLEIFQMKMLFVINDYTRTEEKVDEILNSFKTHFWIHKHRWFVRCHWSRKQECKSWCLYTLPYGFSSFDVYANMEIKSTSPHDDDYHAYDHVQRLHYNSCLSETLSLFQFRNLRYLEYLPIYKDSFCSNVRTDLLTSLFVYLCDITFKSQVQILFDRSPHLYSFQLRTDRNPLSLFDEFTSKSIRQLDLHSPHACWSEQYCTIFSQTSLGLQCEVLAIAVENRTAILCLVKSMRNLRALTVFSRDDPWIMKLDYDRIPPEEDRHIKWLQQRLPSTCTISRIKSLQNKVRLWIH
ncbi:unnamed protein product [Rotaria sp. Silwood1]|nr:unnamed protein product [Rotaria sp. Silwood1]